MRGRLEKEGMNQLSLTLYGGVSHPRFVFTSSLLFCRTNSIPVSLTLTLFVFDVFY